MRRLLQISFLGITDMALFSCKPEYKNLKTEFRNPSNEYRPQPFWWLNGEITPEGIAEQLKNFCDIDCFGGVSPIVLSGPTKEVAIENRARAMAEIAANPAPSGQAEPNRPGMGNFALRRAGRVGTIPEFSKANLSLKNGILTPVILADGRNLKIQKMHKETTAPKYILHSIR
jgi:hypothetical protein